MIKVWDESGEVGPVDYNLNERDLRVIKVGDTYAFQVRQNGVWVSLSPQLDIAGKVQLATIPAEVQRLVAGKLPIATLPKEIPLLVDGKLPVMNMPAEVPRLVAGKLPIDTMPEDVPRLPDLVAQHAQDLERVSLAFAAQDAKHANVANALAALEKKVDDLDKKTDDTKSKVDELTAQDVKP